MDTRLNFINHSADENNSQIVVFQKNVSSDFGETAIAWQVIQNCGRDCRHPFTYAMEATVDAGDSWGNYTPQLPAANGQQFTMAQTTSGDELKLTGNAVDPNEIEVVNGLAKGAISANVYRSGKLIAARTSIAPQQKAVFRFTPSIWIGAVSQVVEGQPMDAAILASITTEFSLLGIVSADIVMTGGGSGPNAKPFQFNLANVVLA